MSSAWLLRVVLLGFVSGIQSFSLPGSLSQVPATNKLPVARCLVTTRAKRALAPPCGVRSLSAIGGDGIQKVKLILREYGVPAVLTHFSGWVVSMTLFYSLLSAGVDLKTLISLLPADIKDHVDLAGAAGLVRLQLSWLATEALGPARLGLTLAITPEISRYMRQYQPTRNLEAFLVRRATSNIRRLRAMTPFPASPDPLAVASSFSADSSNSLEGGLSPVDTNPPPKPTPRPKTKAK